METRRLCAQRGFTLIEAVVVMAITAILAAVAYPAYTSHVARAKRAEARAVLMEAAQFMERAYTATSTYESITLPVRLRTVPTGSSTAMANYRLFLVANADSYTLKATPRLSDACGTLELKHTGERSRTGTEMSEADCWR